MPYLSWPLEEPKQLVFEDWAIFGAPRDYFGDHEGLDFIGSIGDSVLACARGKVVWASNQRRGGGDSDYGNHIIIEHDDGFITWYCHLNEMLSGVGDIVERGDLIGWVGESGRVTGPHLHLNVQRIGYGYEDFIVPDVVDPLDYLR